MVYEHGKATGVRLVDCTQLNAPIVVSALDPRRTFMQLVNPDDLPADLVQAIGDFKFQGSASKVNFALSAVPEFPGLEGRTDIFSGFTNIVLGKKVFDDQEPLVFISGQLRIGDMHVALAPREVCRVYGPNLRFSTGLLKTSPCAYRRGSAGRIGREQAHSSRSESE